jgi:hypothetical protein
MDGGRGFDTTRAGPSRPQKSVTLTRNCEGFFMLKHQNILIRF